MNPAEWGAWQWSGVVTVVWLLLAGLVGLLISQVIHYRNRQAPHEDDPQIPEQRQGGRRPRARPQRWPYGKHHQ